MKEYLWLVEFSEFDEQYTAGRGFDFLLPKECHELHRDSDGWTTIGRKIARFSAIKVCTGMQ